MKSIGGVGLSDVQSVYSGPEGELWELIMGEQIHIGGFRSSLALAGKAGIGKGLRGIDLCCASGAGMRFLVRFREVRSMRGVDATEKMVERGRRRTAEEGLADRIAFTLADVCASGLPAGEADFVWGEDAWCYVVDKEKLIDEAVRLVRPGGAIAFTDWVEGDVPMSDAEARRFLAFMKFPSLQDVPGYRKALEDRGCRVIAAEDTGLYAECAELYIDMVAKQLSYDALKIIGFDAPALDAIAAELSSVLALARAGKLIQGRFIARTPM